MTIGLYCPIKCFCPFRANKLQGIIPQGDALSYVQTLPFQGAIRPPTYSMFWTMYKPCPFRAPFNRQTIQPLDAKAG